MIEKKKRRRKKLNILRRTVAVLAMCLLLLPGLTVKSHADVATDYLTIKVGYLGMDLSEYVEVKKYHWRDLAGKCHEQAYSYFQQSSSTKYTAIVDSARGIYISDILSDANIYYGDVKNLKFYVEDSKGIRTSFDRGSLFKTRYYYEDLAGHRTIIYGTKTIEKEVEETIHHDPVYEVGEDGEEVLVEEGYDEIVTKIVTEEVEDKSKIVGYSFENANKSKKTVQPMLAIEDNWAQFNEEFEHIVSDFSSLSSGTRFRLLFGQSSPTESMTGQSDKYVSSVYVTLEGQPTVGEMGGLNGKYGSHEMTMTVSADNVDIINALSDLMNVKSTNTDVLVITGVKVTPDSKYSDKATVTVSYDIVGAGEASITAGVGASSQPIATSETVTGEGNPKGDENSEKDNTTNGGSTEGNKGDGSVDNKNSKDRNTSDNSEMKDQKQSAAQLVGSSSTFELSDEAAAELNEALQSQTLTAATEDITEIKEEDNTEEKEDEQKKILLLTGLGCLVMLAAGGVSELLAFNIKLGKGKVK